MTATEHMFAADTSARSARSSLRSPGRLWHVYRLTAHMPVFRRVRWLRRVVCTCSAASILPTRKIRLARLRHRRSAAVPEAQDRSLSSSAVSFISQRLWATLTRTYRRKRARLPVGRPTPRQHPTGRRCLARRPSRLVLTGWRVSESGARYGARPGEPLCRWADHDLATALFPRPAGVLAGIPIGKVRRRRRSASWARLIRRKVISRRCLAASFARLLGQIGAVLRAMICVSTSSGATTIAFNIG